MFYNGWRGGSIPRGREYCNLHMKTNGGQEIIANYNTRGRIAKPGGEGVVDPIPFLRKENL